MRIIVPGSVALMVRTLTAAGASVPEDEEDEAGATGAAIQPVRLIRGSTDERVRCRRVLQRSPVCPNSVRE
jgi:hypothetical protein